MSSYVIFFHPGGTSTHNLFVAWRWRYRCLTSNPTASILPCCLENTLYAGTTRFNFLLGAVKPAEEVTQEEIENVHKLLKHPCNLMIPLTTSFETEVGGKGSQVVRWYMYEDDIKAHGPHVPQSVLLLPVPFCETPRCCFWARHRWFERHAVLILVVP